MTAFTSRAAFSVADLELFDAQSSTRSGASRERRFLCPLCGDDKPRDDAHRSLCANTANGAWNCKRCKATGKLSDFWQVRAQVATQAKINGRELARHKRRQLSALPEPPRAPEPASASAADAKEWREQLRDIRVLDCNGNGAAENYLRSRGIDLETAIAAGAMFAPKFYGRAAVVFPICDRDGQQTGASGRYFHANATPKTRIAGTKRSGIFATLGALASDTIIVTEAPIDALSLASVGFAAVALCGTSAPAWMHLACGLKRVVLAFDADDAGDNAAAALAAFLAPYGARCERLRPQGAKDWNEDLQRDSDALREFVARAVYATREFRVLDAYEPARAYAYAAQLLRRGVISREQCAALQRYALRA